MTSKENYDNIIAHLASDGFTHTVGINDLKNAIRNEYTVMQDSHFVFHIKSMEEMRLIRLKLPGVWEIVHDDTMPTA